LEKAGKVNKEAGIKTSLTLTKTGLLTHPYM